MRFFTDRFARRLRPPRMLLRPRSRRFSPSLALALSLAVFALVLVAALFLAFSASAAPKKNKAGDVIWTRPDFASLNVESIAMLPVASYDNNLPNEKLVEGLWGQNFAGSGYRWVSATTSRDNLRRDSVGDSLLRLARNSMVRSGQVDSLLAPALCSRLRVRAVLGLRIDQWERQRLEPEQAGKPSTSLQLRAALVDSAGRLLWSAAGGEYAEGVYHEALLGEPGERGSNALHQSGAGEALGPEPLELVTHLLQRWRPQFPARSAPSQSPNQPASPSQP